MKNGTFTGLTRQINNLRLISRSQIAGAGFFVNGHPREIPHFLMKAGQGIKKRAFSTIRIANETDMYLTLGNNSLYLEGAKL